MVDTRIPIVAGIFIVVLSLGAFWLSIGGPQGAGYNAFDMAGMVGGYIGGQQVNPPSYTQQDYNAYVQAVLPPLIVGNWELDVAMIALTAGMILSFASFAKWTLSRVAGILELAGALLWFSGVSAIGQEASARLAEWAGSGGSTQVSVNADWGTYIAAAGGVFLLADYFLTRIGKLDAPVDSSLPPPVA